jgi:hypothetical protein
MKTTTLCTLTFIILLLTSCGKYKYWDISKFKIDNNALEDGEAVKLYYSSRGPDSNGEREYYIQLIVISQKTGDTVNVLTALDNELTMADKDKVFNFIAQNNIVSKMIQMDPDDLADIKNIDDVNKIEVKKINKVARDPEFDAIADNNYPTIIGTLGTVTENK